MWFSVLGPLRFCGHGLPTDVQTFQGEQHYTLKPMDKIYWLPVSSPTHW